MRLFHVAIAVALSLPACNQAEQTQLPKPQPVVSEEEHEEQHRKILIDGSSFNEDDEQTDERDDKRDDTARNVPTPTPPSNNNNSNNGNNNNNNSNNSNNNQPTPNPDARVVEFRIKQGTGQGPWNSAAEQIVLKVGQTLRVTNDDSVTHQLHTNGAPCPHGTPIRPGQTYECRAAREYSGPPLYDHISRGPVHIRATR